MPTKLVTLKQSARDSATRRGHAIGAFVAGWHKRHYTATCKNCGKTVTVTPRPLPNEISIGGEAVALGCED